MNRDGYWARRLYELLERRFLPVARQRNGRPDQVTWAGLWLSLAAGLAFVLSAVLGGLLLALAGLCDVADGYLARQTGGKTDAGAFLDSVLDRYGELFILAGIWGNMYRQGVAVVPATLLVIAALGGSFLVSYARARGEALGVEYGGGLLQRGERILLFIVAALLDPVLPWPMLLPATAVIAVGANLTAAWRVFTIRNLLVCRAEESSGGGHS